jgi:TonB family protein
VQKPALPLPTNPVPHHPRSLRGQSGSVTVQFIVDASGQIDASSVKVTAATNVGFVDAVKDVLPKFKFTPAELNGEKVAQCVEMPFRFEMQTN